MTDDSRPAEAGSPASAAVDDKAHIRHELDLTGAQWQRVEQDEPVEDALEIAFVPHTDGLTYVAIRSSSDLTGPTMIYTPTEWEAFISGVRDGEFDFS